MNVTSLKSFWLIIVVLLTVSIKMCYGVTCEFCFKDFKNLEGILGVVQLELKIVKELVKHHPLGITLQMLT